MMQDLFKDLVGSLKIRNGARRLSVQSPKVGFVIYGTTILSRDSGIFVAILLLAADMDFTFINTRGVSICLSV